MGNEEDIVLKYADLVYRLALMKTGSRTIADDVFQDVFLKHMKYKDRIKNEEHEKAWFIRVTITTSKAYFLSSWFQKTVPMEQEVPFVSESEGTLYAQVMKLSPNYRTALYLYYYEGYTIKEIAAICRKNENTIKTHLKRGKEQLKLNLEGVEKDEQL